MTPATPLERNDIISRWTGDCIVPASETAADAALRLANAIEILDAVPADILNEAYKLARRVSDKFAPDPGAVYAIAGPMMTERLIDMRIERQRIAELTPPRASVEPSRSLPGPAPSAADFAALAGLGYTWDERGNAVQIRAPVRTRSDEPPRWPTQDDLQSVGDALDELPVHTTMTMTNADYRALGMVG